VYILERRMQSAKYDADQKNEQTATASNCLTQLYVSEFILQTATYPERQLTLHADSVSLAD